MINTTISATEFAAYQSDMDERIMNIFNQMRVLEGRIQSLSDTKEVVEFPDEQAQIREKVLTAFQEEIARLVADINKLKLDVAVLQG